MYDLTGIEEQTLDDGTVKVRAPMLGASTVTRKGQNVVVQPFRRYVAVDDETRHPLEVLPDNWEKPTHACTR